VSGPSSVGSRPIPSGGFELFAWWFMRVSGLALVFLALGHLVIMHLINNIATIDYAFVAARYRTPLWRTYDALLLILALLHGFNGLRVVTDDYLKGGWRLWAQALLGLAALFFLVAGSYIIFAFQPQ
jgi:succinate dehydrogenase / fumarate reductase membrane anchor subunit